MDGVALPDLLDRQRGLATRAQLVENGCTDGRIAAQCAAHRWRRVYPTVYATFTGEPSWEQRVVAAVLVCGSGAAAGFHTAAALHGFAPRTVPVHVVVPARRRVVPPPGIAVHRSRALGVDAVLADRCPPRTRAERTALDLVDCAEGVEAAFGWLADAVQRRCTTAARLQVAAQGRGNLRHRPAVLLALADIAAGAHTELERRWLRLERSHGLPAGRRQVAEHRHGGHRWLDCDYEPIPVRVELDGRLGHDAARERWRDLWRDNDAVLAGRLPLRFGWADLLARGCAAAGQVGRVLSRAGWPGRVRRCGASCELWLG